MDASPQQIRWQWYTASLRHGEGWAIQSKTMWVRIQMLGVYTNECTSNPRPEDFKAIKKIFEWVIDLHRIICTLHQQMSLMKPEVTDSTARLNNSDLTHTITSTQQPKTFHKLAFIKRMAAFLGGVRSSLVSLYIFYLPYLSWMTCQDWTRCSHHGKGTSPQIWQSQIQTAA